MSSVSQPTIIKLYEQAQLTMKQYQEGKWSPNTSSDQTDADVMKFIGRADFAPKAEEVKIQMTGSDHSEEYIRNGAHPALFEYMKQFEKQPEKDVDPSIQLTQAPVPNFLKQDIFPQATSKFETFESQVPERPLGDSDNKNGLDPLPELFGTTNQATRSTDWNSSTLYDNPLFISNSSQGRTPDTTLLFEDLFVDQGVTGNHINDKESHDQVWEQFLSTLMT
jgi:hypothetical protein